MLPESAPYALAAYRYEKAASMLTDARLLYNAEQWSSANNRAYYCIFHAMRAVLALRQLDFKKHSGVISAFGREFIHPGHFDKKYAGLISHASIIRNQSDYDDFYICSGSETSELIADASDFLNVVRSYLLSQGCILPE